MSADEFAELRAMLARYDAAQVEEREAEREAAQAFGSRFADAPEAKRLFVARVDLQQARETLQAHYSVKR